MSTILNNTQNRIRYDVTATERCPLCEEDIQVGTAGPQGLAQHKGKMKCLANVKKKQQEMGVAKTPTLFSYLRQQGSNPPTPANLAKEVERSAIESSSRVVVSCGAISQAISEMHADQDAQVQGGDVDADPSNPSTDRDLDSDLDQILDQAWDQDEPPAWSTVKVRGGEPKRKSQAGNTISKNVWNDVQIKGRSADDAEEARRCMWKPEDTAQGSLARKGCHEGWLLLDRLRAEIGTVC